MNRTFCFVPVRKGSRGIPGKNLRLLGDKPLVCWIIDTILASGIADEVCVATNCDEMESLIRGRYKGVVQIFRRSEWSARQKRRHAGQTHHDGHFFTCVCVTWPPMSRAC